MTIRIILILISCGLLLWFMRQRVSTRSQAWGKVGALLLFVLAVIAIIAPDITNRLAHLVGVGRGADLLLYVLTVVFLANLLMQYMRRQDDHLHLVQLSRQLAINQANQLPRNQRQISKLRHQITRSKKR